ncbi:MAG: sigma-70 family RNA polymerase sigma factor [Dehalococcoidia bacterium]|nr:sigma-70 family RNA polymerase sigma factor [Dehalococcoidia bacterium]
MSDDRSADVDLVQAVAGGEEAALGVLYDRLHRQCFAFALGMLAAEPDAEEAVQETFVRVWRRAGQYDRTRAGVASWVLSITRNLCLDELRRRRRRAPESEPSVSMLERSAADRTDDEALRGVVAEQVRAALQALPGGQRLAIELVYFQGLSSQEVGSLLQVPAATVRSRLRLGLLKLGALLRAQGLVAAD